MYYDRILSDFEALYVSRAQQRIADLGAALGEQMLRNDVDYAGAQLIVELQHSINVLRSTDLNWTGDEIRMMIDYYTKVGRLIVFAFREINFDPISPKTGEVYVTMPQFNTYIYNNDVVNTYLQTQIDNLTSIINNIGVSQELSIVADLTADEDVGGIYKGTTFPAGTLLEDIWRDMLTTRPIIENLLHNTWEAIVEVGSTINVASLTWDIKGTPINPKLNDSVGQLVDLDVPGTAITLGTTESYVTTPYQVLEWTISADNVTPIVLQTKAVYKSYYGKKVTSSDGLVTITEADILAGSKTSIVDTEEEVTFQADTTNMEQAWIAVEKTQTGGDYTNWKVGNDDEDANSGNIAVGSFISTPVDVLVNGVTYSVYRWSYRTPLTRNLTLFR